MRIYRGYRAWRGSIQRFVGNLQNVRQNEHKSFSLQAQKYLKTHNNLLNPQRLCVNSVAETPACILTVLVALAIDCLVTLDSWPESGGLTPTVAEFRFFTRKTVRHDSPLHSVPTCSKCGCEAPRHPDRF